MSHHSAIGFCCVPTVCEHMCRRTDGWTDRQTHTHTNTRARTQNQSTHSNARFLDTLLTDYIKPLQTTIYVKGSSNIWAYPRHITHINDEETMPIYVRSQSLQTKTLLTPWSQVNQSIISPYFMKPKGSLVHSQEPITCPYPEPDHQITNCKNVKE
jgi:hypothetical protein